MVGAQAQTLPAAEMSIATRVKDSTLGDVDHAIWKDHTLVRAWAMRRTMFLLPADELAIFIRGTGRRAQYVFNWAASRIGSQQQLDKLFDNIIEELSEPRTRGELARTLSRSYGYKFKSKRGGGWGSKRSVPWIEIGQTSLPLGYLLHAIAARDAICCGPGKGAEATYVSAAKWIKNWKDIPREKGERMLLLKYLRAFGPATVQDFALWAGFYVRDAKPIWKEEEENMTTVDLEGTKASILQSDLPDLENARLDEPIVRLLPYFDSYLLGHRSHRNIVEQRDHKKVYRSQGWVSPVLLVDGRAAGVWSHQQYKTHLEIRVSPFAKLPNHVSSQLQEEGAQLGRFLESPNVKTIISK
jgi:hypothetical protein